MLAFKLAALYFLMSASLATCKTLEGMGHPVPGG